MENIWAPWRVKYITKVSKEKKGCVFCRIFEENKDKKNFIVFRTKYSFAVLNIYPYNNGHILILPNRHVNDISKLRKEERDDFFCLMDDMKALMDKVLSPQGYNIGMNLGKVSGAGHPGHLHMHIVPRWSGDINFMPIIANTKVISASLKSLYDKLLKCLHAKK